MPRSATTGVYTRVVNSFSQPVFGTLIDPTDADAYFDDLDAGLNPANFSGPTNIIGALTLGKAGTTVGTLGFFNATSGSITISPPTGALGSVTMTLPDATDTFVGKATTDILSNKTLVAPALGVATATSLAINGATLGTDKLAVTGSVTFSGAFVVNNTIAGGAITGTSTSATALAVGSNGATNPAFQVDASTASQAAGLKFTGAATGGTVAVAAIDSGSNTNLTINAKGTGTLAIGAVSTGAVSVAKVTITPPATSATLTLIDGTVLTGPAATGTLVTKTSTDILTNKTLDSAGTGNVLKVSGVTVSAGQYPGEPTTGSATAGNVGEYIESVILIGSPVSLVSSTAKTLTSISLTAGDWDVDLSIYFLSAGTTNVTRYIASISGTTNTLDTTAGKLSDNSYPAFVPGATGQSSSVPPYRISLSGTTTVFAVGFSTFTVSTMSMYGIISARRAR